MLQLHKADGSGDGAAPAIAIRREDYTAPAYWIDSVELTFDLDPAKTRVLNRMTLRRNPDVAAQPLKLDGDDLNLARVLVNGQGTSFKMEGTRLVLENLPDPVILAGRSRDDGPGPRVLFANAAARELFRLPRQGGVMAAVIRTRSRGPTACQILPPRRATSASTS